MEFWACYSDVISREHQRKSREKPAVLSGVLSWQNIRLLKCQGTPTTCQVTPTTSESSQHSTRHWIVCWFSLTVDLIFFLQTGDSVMVAGQKTGTVRFVGRTQFASGWVLWIALEEEISFLPHLHWRQYWDPFPFFSCSCKPDQLVNSHHPDDK